jgi:hypothetical protein
MAVKYGVIFLERQGIAEGVLIICHFGSQANNMKNLEFRKMGRGKRFEG